jgi:hypothetical protein
MADFDIHYDPITVNTDTTTVEVKGLDDIQTALTIATPQPIKAETKSELKAETKSDLALQQTLHSDSKFELSIPQPIRSETTSELDVKPLAVDQCLRISFGPLPSTCVRQPYHQRFGFTLFGVEIFGFSIEGEGQTMVSDLPSKPHVVWGEEREASRQPSEYKTTAEPAHAGGLRIRLDH